MPKPEHTAAISRTATPRALHIRTMSMIIGWLIRGGAEALVEHLLDDLDG